jgi:hypothetical protein
MIVKAIVILIAILYINLIHAQTEEVGVRTTVFVDENANGFKDPNESNLGDVGVVVTMELLDQDMNLVATSATDQLGAAFFGGLDEGSYYLQFMPASRYNFSSPVTNENDDDIFLDDNGTQEDSDGDGISDGLIRSPLFSLNVGQEATNEPPGGMDNTLIDENNNWTLDFGVLACQEGIQGLLYIDDDIDGCPDTLEKPEYNIVNLYLCESNSPKPLGTAISLDSRSGIEFRASNYCLTDYHEYYIEVESTDEASFLNNDTCSVISITDRNDNLAQSSCFSLLDLVDGELNLGYSFLTNTSEIVRSEEIKLYPNPMEDYILVESKHLVQYVKFYDNSARLVKNTKVENYQQSYRIDTSDLLIGFYLVEIVFLDNTIISKSLVKL